MAHFRGTVQGSRTQESRLGTKRSGLRVEAQSWQGKVIVTLRHNEATGKDMVTVELAQHFGGGVDRPVEIFYGPVDGSEVKVTA